MRILVAAPKDDLGQEVRRAFWQKHRPWEVLLAHGAEEALAALGRELVDVLITVNAAPPLDGLDLLREVRERHPGVVRMLLMDHPSPEEVKASEEEAHRCFTRPVTPAFLLGVLESLESEDDPERQHKIRSFVGGLGRIPSLPTLYSELVALLQREDAGMGEVARLVRKDLGVASEVLKLANSVHCGAGRQVSELGQALAMLGMDSLRALVLFRGMISGSEAHPQGLDLEKLWLHSFDVATGVRKLVVLEGETQLADLAFSVGLLHDIGLVVLATDASHGYRAILEKAQASRVPLAVLEQETYGVDHTQVGAHLLSLWGLPPAFCRPVREHHAPPLATEGFPLSLALHLSDVRHGGGKSAGIFADGRWGLHPHVLADAERFARWKACLAMDPA
jgi:HD-like signal output (HDOD) protein